MKAKAGALVVALAALKLAGDLHASDEQPPFCAKREKHHILNKEKPESGPVPDGKARVYVFWSGMRWRWFRSQCKVALNGTWVAVLSPNTYSLVDVEPGKLRLCAGGIVGGRDLAPTWRSLLFLHAAAGQTHYLECSPGGDQAGASEPTLSEAEERDGTKAVSRSRLVTFELKPEKVN